MADIETESRENWHDLRLLLDDYFTHYNGYIFRGQADAMWPLESTLTRALRRRYPHLADPQSLVQEHLSNFIENIRGRCALDLSNPSIDALWSLGQHFGLHTPFLDWSRSPYVALFFALFGECKSGRRSLWALLESDIEGLSPQTAKPLVRVVKPRTHENMRLVNQNGLFLDVAVGRRLEEIVREGPDAGWVTMYKIDYPDLIRDDIFAALNNMNINHASLFPDLMGSSQQTNFQLEIESYLEQGRVRGFIGDDS